MFTVISVIPVNVLLAKYWRVFNTECAAELKFSCTSRGFN